MKFLYPAIFLLVTCYTSFAQFDVQHYDIRLEVTPTGTNSIKGCSNVYIQSEINGLQQIDLSLLKLNVDSIIINQSIATYIYNDTVLNIQLPASLNHGDSTSIKICYHGQPVMDASGWGGFYRGSNYAFNLGVGFEANPHTYGRVWFPCVDNFTDRATYDFHITTNSAYKAFCNGLLQNETNNGNNTTTSHWKLYQTIPTYLASFAVSDYASVNTKYPRISGDSVPVTLAARAVDTVKMKNSFVHLPEALEGFESRFGPYLFDRIGFVLVQFSSGAMEHATNVAYPRVFADGTLQYESLMAHEFSHHWWGDLVTCSTAEDMWLNEGWASYSENIFFEHVYGKDRYKKEVRKNHASVLQYAHIKDDGFRAVAGVPHEYTYGTTVYDKGSDVAHTLRGYLGDDLFFQCLTDYLNAYQFKDASSENFRDHLSSCSGRNLQHFFDDWVFEPGFPHFSIDSFEVVADGNNFDVVVNLRQRLKAAPHLYNHVPIDLTFFSGNFDTITTTVLMSGSCGIYYTQLPFEPVFIAVDLEEKISDAITDKFLEISSTGNYDFEEAFMEVDVTQVSSTAFVRIEHNWIAPDQFKTPISGLHISNERFWKVDGIIPAAFRANATILYNGTNSLSGGYLDNVLLSNLEDSLVMLYRASAAQDWSLVDSFLVVKGFSATDKKGEVVIFNLKKGEYALGIYDHARQDSSIQVTNEPCLILSDKTLTDKAREFGFNIYPNPANDSFRIEFDVPVKNDLSFSVIDLSGKTLTTGTIAKNEKIFLVKTNGWKKGIYFTRILSGSNIISKKVVIIN